MRTIGRHWPTKSPRGDYQAMCDICGAMWRRSQLTRKRDGYLYCPDDVRGDDAVTLAEANSAPDWQMRSGHRGGHYYNDESVTTVYNNTAEDVEA